MISARLYNLKFVFFSFLFRNKLGDVQYTGGKGDYTGGYHKYTGGIP